MLERLNDPETIKSIDISDMLGVIGAFPAQCREAVSLAESFDFGKLSGDVSSIVTLGMGGSGIGGDIVKALLEPKSKVPVNVCKGYSLPAFVGPDTLVFAISYSGGTEETLTTLQRAADVGSKIIAVTSDGSLEKEAKKRGFPVIKVPGGLQPRAALGYLSLTVVVVLEKLGFIEDVRADIEETLGILEMMSEHMSPDSPAGNNIAKQLAGRLYEKMPVVYGSEGTPAVAALRWKCQFNENSKVPAFWHQFPELNHNEIVGWQELGEVAKRCCLITLRSPGENPRTRKRVEISLPLLEGVVGESLQVWSEGDSELARLYSLIYLGDFTSVYLAILNGVDPTPVERIQLLKKKLREGK
ncbi:MAG: bifunctional phosphoglucose/phosphomannose isomerase [Actinomycetota bacterium]